MDSEMHINGAVSALVMLAAVVSVYTTYSYYNDQKIADQYDENRVGLEQAASALASLHSMQDQSAASVIMSTSSDTSKDATKNAASVEYAF